MKKLFGSLAFVAALMAAPASAQNQFPDPLLLAPADYTAFGYPDALYRRPALVFANAATSDIVMIGGDTNTALLSTWAASESRQMSVNVTSWTAGDVQCRFRMGTWTALGIAGAGMSTPVTITAGEGSGGLQCRGLSGTTLVIASAPPTPAILLE